MDLVSSVRRARLVSCTERKRKPRAEVAEDATKAKGRTMDLVSGERHTTNPDVPRAEVAKSATDYLLIRFDQAICQSLNAILKTFFTKVDQVS